MPIAIYRVFQKAKIMIFLAKKLYLSVCFFCCCFFCLKHTLWIYVRTINVIGKLKFELDRKSLETIYLTFLDPFWSKDMLYRITAPNTNYFKKCPIT